jgi:hypothetical protein
MSQPDLDQLLQAIRALPRPERSRLVETVARELAGEGRGGGAALAKAIVGLFADDPDLIDEVCESAMKTRERDPLRR